MIESIKYKPFDERTVDVQYHNLLKKIMEQGRKFRPIHARLPENKNLEHKESLELTGEILQFDMRNGFPLLPVRDLSKSFKGALGEIIGFMRGAQTMEELKSAGCPNIFWERWVSEEKCKIFGLPPHDLGPGSYGATMRRTPTNDGIFDQLSVLIKQMRDTPTVRTNVLTTWYPPYALSEKGKQPPRKVVVAPCHGNFVHFILFDEEKELEMTHTQRSADVPVGLALNLVEWAAVGMMVAHLLGYTFTKYTHFISEPHIYDIQYDSVKELLSRESRKLPSVYLKPDRVVENIWDFKPEDFKIGDDYNPHGPMVIPTPV